jgi:hypothetical protein
MPAARGPTGPAPPGEVAGDRPHPIEWSKVP